MSAFEKVLNSIKNPLQYGHAIQNAQNKKSLQKAKEEIEMMLQAKPEALKKKKTL